ncbi:hypothetical protein [Psychrobacter sp. I-STPA10]|uniref:hypothetical protein n=1 Tax=Psychrobacter sp. I-STPA10 TaxID=2585769 RepID=UPI001E376CBB|nr:hypothetical protein [Psychrobacter sp. I-STPA10]
MSVVCQAKHAYVILEKHLSVKRVVIFILLLISILFCALYTLLWHYNHSISAPLPIESTLNTQTMTKTFDNNNNQSILHILAAQSLQSALIPIVERFDRHHPEIQVHVHYIDPIDLNATKTTTTHPIDILLIPQEMPADEKLHFTAAAHPIATPSIQTVDEFVDTKQQEKSVDSINSQSTYQPSQTNIHSQPSATAHYWQQFNFALQGQTLYQSRLLTDQEASILFSRFLLTSNSQDDFIHAGLQSIDFYHNQVDDQLSFRAILPTEISTHISAYH